LNESSLPVGSPPEPFRLDDLL